MVGSLAGVPPCPGGRWPSPRARFGSTRRRITRSRSIAPCRSQRRSMKRGRVRSAATTSCGRCVGRTVHQSERHPHDSRTRMVTCELPPCREPTCARTRPSKWTDCRKKRLRLKTRWERAEEWSAGPSTITYSVNAANRPLTAAKLTLGRWPRSRNNLPPQGLSKRFVVKETS